MKFRPFSRTASEVQHLLLEQIQAMVKVETSHFVSPENVHTYEHGLTIDYVDAEQKARNASLKQHGANSIISIPKIINGEFGLAASFVNDMVSGLAGEIKKTLFQTLEQVTTETGNIVDGKGQKISEEILLEAYEKLSYGLDENGNISLPTFVLSPLIAEQARAIQARPEFQVKLNEILKRKLEEAKKEEAHRKSKFPKRIG